MKSLRNDRVNQTNNCRFKSLGRSPREEASYSFYDRVRKCLLHKPDSLNSTLSTSTLRASQQRLEAGSNVIRVENQADTETGRDTEVIRLINLAAMIPIKFFAGLTSSTPFSNAMAKAALMAVFHFNNRLDTVVPELDQRLKTCNVKMTLDFFDTQLSPIEAARVLDQYVHKQAFPYQTTAVVGAALSSVSSQLATLNSIRLIPQVSFASASTILDNKGTYPLFGRTVSSNKGKAIVAVDYLQNALNITHFGILYVRDEYGTSYRRALQVEASRRQIKSVAYAIPPSFMGEGMGAALKLLKESGFHYFIGIFYDSALRPFLREAQIADVIGPGYFWMLGENADSTGLSRLLVPANSSLIEAARGLAFLSSSTDSSSRSFSGFLEEWGALDNDRRFREYFALKSPLGSDVKFSADYPTSISNGYASQTYDAVMSLGISACELEQEFFSGPELFASFLKLKFTGATGVIEIDPTTGSRTTQTSTFIIKNIVPQEPNPNGLVHFKAIKSVECTCRSQDDCQANHWCSFINGTRFIYSDGTTVPPISLPPLVVNENRVDKGLIISGLVLGVMIMLAALFFGLWTWCHRKSWVVQRSQPIFLGILCVGIALMASAVFSLSASAPPLSAEAMDFFCMFGYWSYTIGFGLTYSALISKMLRVNRIVVNQSLFSKVVVSPKDVMLPGVIIISCNVFVLMLWQVLAPLKYSRELLDTTFDHFGRPMESLGSCGTPEGDIPSQVFLSILAFINLTALIFANVEAYKARHINTEYSESLYVGYAMVTLLQTVVIGAPLILIPTDPQTGFLIHTILLIVSSASVLFLIFVPKLHFYYLDLRERGKMEETGLDCHIDVIEEQEEKEEEEEQNRGIRIVHVDSMVETQNTQQPNQYGLRIVRRQYIPQSRPSRNAEATVPKRKQRPKKVYDNTAPAAEVANFAMMAM